MGDIFHYASRRPLGRSGVTVAPYIFGAAPLGNLFTPISDEQASETVTAAWEAGFRCFDVAPHYGLGLAEERLGRALAGRPRQEYLVSTKVGRLIEHESSSRSDITNGFAITTHRRRRLDYSRDGVLRSMEDSLNRLRLDHLDVVLVHDPEQDLPEALEGAFPALDQLRRQGVIRSYGAGANTTGVLESVIRETDADVILTARHLSLTNAEAERDLLPLAQEFGVSVVAAGVFDQGSLTTATTRGPLVNLCDRHGVSLQAAALAFPLRNPAVTTVAIGMRSAREVQENTRAMEAVIPKEFWAELHTEYGA